MVKLERQTKILQIIEDNNIETQEELTGKLRLAGIQVTQATVSRDIKELNLIKVMAENGSYKYAQYNSEQLPFDSRIVTIFCEAVQSIDYAGNFICIHTFRGMANAAAVAIDSLKYDEILGSVAGDDTIFVMARSPKKAQELVKYFKQLTKL